jgi:energy-coupling factor transport system ATP-binding protein
MKSIEISGASYRYPGREEYALRDFSLSVEKGEFVVLFGPSGCGKSTVCRMLNGLIPHFLGGRLEGTVTVAGLDAAKHTTAELSRKAGLVFQEPENQIVASTVEDEIAFGLENLRAPADEMAERVRRSAERLGISGLLGRRTDELSCGERQRVVLASVLAMRPEVVVMDEPTSQIDPDSRKALLEFLRGLSRGGVTVVLVEHNLDEAKRYADRLIPLAPAEKPEPAPQRSDNPPGDVLLEVSGLCGGYGGRKILDGISFEVRGGQCLAVTGPNGSGKSTLLRHLNGLMRPSAGKVAICGVDSASAPVEELARKVAYLPQNPSDMLFCDTAEDELRFTLRHLGKGGDVESALRRFDLLQNRLDYPRDLSVGQRQRLALAAVLVSNPRVALLDEPTRGIDERMRAELASAVRDLLAAGGAAVIVTHDRRLVEEVATSELRLGGPP